LPGKPQDGTLGGVMESILASTVLSSSMLDLLRVLGRVSEKRRSRSVGEQEEIDDATLRAFDALSPDIREAITEVAADVERTDSPAKPVPAEPRVVSPIEAGAALTFAPQLFLTARKRISLMFRIRLGLAVVLGAILVTALILCIISLYIGQQKWALLFGGLTLVDVLGFAFSKPLKAVTDAVTATQRLEWLNLRVQVDLDSCAQLADPHDRIECQGKLWESIQSQLAAMGG
jgi:hypothetical protein